MPGPLKEGLVPCALLQGFSAILALCSFVEET